MLIGDEILIDNLTQLMNSPYTDKGAKVRPIWEDGSPAYSKKVFGQLHTYNSLPVTTLRPTAWKAGLKELLWIYKDKSNNVDLLEEKYGVKYWREWANEDGDLGLAYGKQMSYEHEYKEGYFNQIDRLIWDLKNNPYSRRMLTNLYNHEDLHGMTLYPCAFLTMWDYDGEKLNMTLVQRSSDNLTAGAINATQYWMLLQMIAQVTGLKAGQFNHYINNMHIYDRHIPIAQELLTRVPELPSEKPIFEIDTSIKHFDDFKLEHFNVENYNPLPNVKIPIAI